MKKDKVKTDVIFRIVKYGTWKGIVFALLPHDAERDGSVQSYQHVGQHSGAHYQRCLTSSRLATPKEYKELKQEMERGHGYNFNVIKKQNFKKYLESYREANK